MRPPGRPRSFDTERALDRALDVFWENGFAATSLDDLCEAMSIARPSLYAAYGDKEALYFAAMGRFRDRMVQLFRAHVIDEPDAARSFHDRLLAYFTAVIAHYTAEGARGCVAYCTATAEAAARPKFRAALAEAVHHLDAALEATLQRARGRGELAATADPAQLAPVIAAAQQAIAIRARAGAAPEALAQLARTTLGLVFGKPAASPPARATKRKAAR